MRSALALWLLLVVACSKPATYRSNFAEVKVSGDKLLTASNGDPYTGTVVAVDREILEVAKVALVGNAYERVSDADTDGLVLVVPFEGGVPHGKAKVIVDLRAKKISGAVMKDGRLAIAKSLSPTVTIAEATFVRGKLDGVATIYGPGSGSSLAKVAEIPFRAGDVQGVATEYHAGSSAPRRTVTIEANVPHGPEKLMYPSGKVERTATFVRGKLDGDVLEYYANGAKRAHATYAAGARIREEAWFPSGQKKREIVHGEDGETRVTEWYSNGQETSSPPHGTIEEFYGDGARKSQAMYEHGVKAGSSKQWYASGQLWEEATYVAGVRTGAYRKWWKNGKPAHVYAYKDGKLDGEYRQFYDSGAKWVEATYANGKPVGLVQRWYPDGRLGYVMHHEDGRPHGPYKRWWANGTPRLEASHDRGRLHGDFKNWLADGTVYELATYDRGRVLTTTRPQPAPPTP